MLLIVGQGILVAETLRSDLEVLQVEWNVGWINDTLGTLPSRILELPEYTGPVSQVLGPGSCVLGLKSRVPGPGSSVLDYATLRNNKSWSTYYAVSECSSSK